MWVLCSLRAVLCLLSAVLNGISALLVSLTHDVKTSHIEDRTVRQIRKILLLAESSRKVQKLQTRDYTDITNQSRNIIQFNTPTRFSMFVV